MSYALHEGQKRPIFEVACVEAGQDLQLVASVLAGLWRKHSLAPVFAMLAPDDSEGRDRVRYTLYLELEAESRRLIPGECLATLALAGSWALPEFPLCLLSQAWPVGRCQDSLDRAGSYGSLSAGL